VLRPGAMSAKALKGLTVLFWTAVGGVGLSALLTGVTAYQEHKARESRDLSKIVVPSLPATP
jgi:hypothetical protein